MSSPLTLEVPTSTSDVADFIDRRRSTPGSPARERRQFSNSHEELTADGAELARAIDGYKARHRRRFIDCDELLAIVRTLGYERA